MLGAAGWALESRRASSNQTVFTSSGRITADIPHRFAKPTEVSSERSGASEHHFSTAGPGPCKSRLLPVQADLILTPPYRVGTGAHFATFRIRGGWCVATLGRDLDEDESFGSAQYVKKQNLNSDGGRVRLMWRELKDEQAHCTVFYLVEDLQVEFVLGAKCKDEDFNLSRS